MESKTTSKTSSLKALMIQAWRERWTDVQWATNIKTVLPRGVSGDVYNLADCILQQALVGAGANQLMISYLKHAHACQLVSSAAVLKCISKFNELTKHYCVIDLLDFFDSIIPGVTYNGKSEELLLATAILSITGWLVSILIQCKDAPNVIEKASTIFQKLMKKDFYLSMMCLARYNDTELFDEIKQKCIELSASLPQTEDLFPFVKQLENLSVNTLRFPLTHESWPGSLIECWLAVMLDSNPCTTTGFIMHRLRLFQRLKGYSDTRLYAEIIRGGLCGLYGVHQTSHESQWGAFAFLKVPHLLAALTGRNDSASIVAAVELVLQHTALLDRLDTYSTCSTIECLLGEFSKAQLITEAQSKYLMEKRTPPPKVRVEKTSVPGGIPKIIICAEPTLAGILKTLSADYHRIQDPLVGMLHQVLTGKSFELILAVAAVQEHLPTLVSCLVRINDCGKFGEEKLDSQLFDISFLMLVSVVQNYGSELVLDPEESSMFEQWARACLVDHKKPKPHEQILRLGDPSTINMLIQQFKSGESNFKPNVKWQDVIFSMPGVMHDVLIAWEAGVLQPSEVKTILNAVRGKMCCVPVAAAAWLCTYMRTGTGNFLKPANMVQELLTPPEVDNENLKGRWQLTCEIIRKMQQDIEVPVPTQTSHNIISKEPLKEKLLAIWHSSLEKGWLDHSSTRSLYALLNTAGPAWLIKTVIDDLVEQRRLDRLDRGVDVALAFFHVDIRRCTMELLTNVLPTLLFNETKAPTLMDPHLGFLGRLTCYCVYSAYYTHKEEPKEGASSRASNEHEENATELITALRNYLVQYATYIRRGKITPLTYFIHSFLKTLIEVKIDPPNPILHAIPPNLITDMQLTLREEYSYPLIFNLHDVFSVQGRINMAKDFCLLRHYNLRLRYFYSID